jgi:radical SAM superfamily enzyme YgiQ (UPF0313 family)
LGIVTLESQTPVRDFDIFAFSVSFEWDYTNVLTMLELAGLKFRACDRDRRDPLVVIGGAVTFVNPEPLAPFADVIAAGEAELLVPGLVDAWHDTHNRPALLGRLATQRGFYIPASTSPWRRPRPHRRPVAVGGIGSAADRAEGGRQGR